MNPFDDMLPEEQEDQHRELIALLRQAYLQSLASTASAQEQAIQRVGERLAIMEDSVALSEVTLPGQLNVEQASLREYENVVGRPRRRKRAIYLIDTLAAVLVVGLLIGASIVLFTNRSQSTTAGPVGAPTTVRVEASGLEMSMNITPGPYFLSEVLVADMTLTNHTNTTFMLREGLCFPALRLEQTGGESPHYTLPLYGDVVFFGCNEREGLLEPGQTITNQQYELLTSSGQVTLTTTAKFVKDVVMKVIKPGFGPVDVHGNTPVSNPLGRWPSLHIQVASHIPSDRLFSLHLQGSHVLVDAPPAVHLVYQYIVSCDSHNVTIDTGNWSWEPISTRVLRIPGSDCPGNVRWQYAVSAAGYAVVAGKYPA
jgi:hypothetical protein